MGAYSAAVLATSGLLSYWRLGGTSGAAVDSEGTVSGTVGSAVTRGVTGLLSPGDADKAAQFTASANSYVNFGDHLDFTGTNPWSVEFLIKHDGNDHSVYRRILDKIDGAGFGVRIGLLKAADSPAHGIFVERRSSGGSQEVDSVSGLTANTVYHVVVAYDGTNIKIYIDGALDKSGASAASVADNTANLFMGNDPNFQTQTFTGVLDEVAVYGAALSGTTVTSHWSAFESDAGLLPPDAPTVAISGTFDGYTLGPDRFGRILVGVTAAGTGGTAATAKLWRANTSGGSFTEVTANCEVINTSAGKWVIVDKRPAYGTPSIALGGTGYYKAKTANGADSAFSSEVNAASNINKAATENAHFAVMSAAIAAGGGHANIDDGYLGQFVQAMAYAYYKTGTAQYLTDCMNQSSWIASSVVNSDGLYLRLSDPTHVYRDFHFRNVMHHMTAARLLDRAGATSSAATLRARAEAWAKAGIDKLSRTSITVAGYQADSQTAWSSGPIAAGEIRRPTTANGRAYRAQNAGTAATQPTWPTTNGGTVTADGITWKETTRTGSVFNNTYTVAGPYTAVGGNSVDLNQNSECAAALAILVADVPSFQTGGAYHASAQTIITDQVSLISAMQRTDGGVPVSTDLATIDTHYASFTLHTMALINKLQPMTDGSLWVARAANWFNTSYASEPTVSNAGAGGYATRILLAELVWRDAGYRVAGLANPLADLPWTTAFQAHDDGTQPYVYTQAGNSVDTPVPLYQYMHDGDAVVEAGLAPVVGSIGVASETDTARSFTPLLMGPILIGVATETDAARSIAPHVGVVLPPAPPRVPLASAAQVAVPHFALPFRFERGRVVVNEQDSIDDVAACVEAVLRTRRGEREDIPEFGIVDPTFSQLPLAAGDLVRQVETWEPRAHVLATEAPDVLDETVRRVRFDVSIQE